jgi:formate dehydrogenase
MKLAAVEVYEVASFYHHFDFVRAGDCPPTALTVRVCDSLSCSMAGADALAEKLPAFLGRDVRVQRVSCVGRCDCAPVAVVGKNPIAPATIEAVAQAVTAGDIQAKLPLAQRLEAYRAGGGYALYQDCLAGRRMREDVVATLERSGLRGMGGAGFPSARKWEAVRAQPGPRHLVVNIDEGEPGTFKDRHYLESEPHRFLEGALIAAWAVEAERIWIYLRDEYAGCHALLDEELRVLATFLPQAPAIELRRGAGAYVCGEESALIESIEGRRGEPRLRPPYVAERGLFGRPTLVHNLETLHWLPIVLERGPEWFAAHGRHGYRGLRSYSVSGRVTRPGVYLAAAGITLAELIAEYCGGMVTGHVLYGYFPGGASGGILPASKADLPLDFDTLGAHGCFIGSAGIVVFSQADSARSLATNAMRFFARESCGQCSPCRVGTVQAAQMMAMKRWDIALLGDLGQVMQDASICGLGQAAPNAMHSVLCYFPQELEREK